jgi:hypothetical protein
MKLPPIKAFQYVDCCVREMRWEAQATAVVDMASSAAVVEETRLGMPHLLEGPMEEEAAMAQTSVVVAVEGSACLHGERVEVGNACPYLWLLEVLAAAVMGEEVERRWC